MFGPLCPLISSGKTRDMAEIPKNRLLMSSDSHFHLTHSTSLPMVRILAPVLVLLTLLLATGLAALGRYMLQWRKKGEQRWMGVGRRLSAGDRTETCSPLTSPERPRGSGDLSDTLASGVLPPLLGEPLGRQQWEKAIQMGQWENGGSWLAHINPSS